MTAETDLAAIRARDAGSGALWFTGPESFTALAARDRRTLLAEIERLDRKCSALALLLYGLPADVKGDA